jgi:hypothetical protein
VRKIGARYSMFLGSLCYTAYVGSFILASMRKDHSGISKLLLQVVICVAAIINGFGAAILWVAQGNYISLCACERNKGTYNGVFWVFYMGSYIVGNLMAAFVIVNVN